MALPATAPTSPPAQIIQQLGRVCQRRGLPDLATRLVELQTWIADDLDALREQLASLQRGERLVMRTAHHLLDLGGKHLRPMCVALATRVGGSFDEAARQLAVAVELVHTATLLHDDVVDLGDVRRGAPAARAIYGNAAAIFAGDWLLIEALRRVREARVPGALDHMLEVINEMILAESLQLEGRGTIPSDVSDYFRVVEGKTAALFRWAMAAGARAGGVSTEARDALELFGAEVGVAFQLVDDALDFADTSDDTGKSLLTDLREGKMTHPLLIALETDISLRPQLESAVEQAGRGDPIPTSLARSIRDAVVHSGAIEVCRAEARRRVDRAISALDVIPDGKAKESLITVAQATAHRER